MKNKLFILSIVVVFVLSCFVIPCCAFDTYYPAGTTYQFKDVLDFSQIPNSNQVAAFIFSSNDQEFDGFYYSYRGYHVLGYSQNNSYVVVYDNNGWVDDAYKTIVFADEVDFSGEKLDTGAFLYNNRYSVSGFYNDLFDTLSEIFFDGRSLTSVQHYALSIVTCFACLFVVALIPIVIYLVIKLIISIGERLMFG